MGEIAVRCLFSEREIADCIDRVAGDIAGRLRGDFVVVGLLVGGFVFVADLIRALSRQGCSPQVELIRLGSYGLGRESSGSVRLMSDLATDIRGRDVLLVDDIVDTGRTFAFAKTWLQEKGAARICGCALLDKPERREVPIELDFVGFTVPDLFVVGYGIDYAHEYRHLPYIGTIDR